jgi:hypothetical protein
MSQFALPDVSSLTDIMFYYLIEIIWINGSFCEQVTFKPELDIGIVSGLQN